MFFDCCCYFRDNKKQIHDKDLFILYQEQDLVKQITNEELSKIIIEKDFEKFKFFIRNSEKEISKDDNYTLIKYVCELGDERFLQLLFQRGVTFDSKNSNSSEYINNPKQSWLLETVSKLFHSETKLPKKSELGPYKHISSEENPLLYILNVRNTSQSTLLHQAAYNGEVATIKNIIALDTNFSHKKLLWEHTRDEKYVCYENYEPISLNAIDSNGNTALHFLAAKGHGVLVSSFLKNGAIYNIKNNEGRTPEFVAKINNNNDCARRLQKVRNLFEKIKYGSCKDKKLYTKQCLNAKNGKGETLLHLAVSSNRDETLKILLEKDVDLNSRDLFGSTPLHLAAKYNKLQKTKLLLEKGAYFNIVNRNGQIPLEIANDKIKSMLKLIKTLFEIILSESPLRILEKLTSEEIKLTISPNIIVNVKNEKGNTLLHYAVQLGYIEIVKFLLEFGADFDSRNQIGETPISIATHRPKIKHFLQLTKKFYSDCAESVEGKDDYFESAKEQLGTEMFNYIIKKFRKSPRPEDYEKINVRDAPETEMFPTHSRSNYKKRPLEDCEYREAKKLSRNPGDSVTQN